jgi:hypothetical protein
MKGIIYEISADETDKVYIGSTTRTLNIRFSKHKSKHNQTSSKELFNYKNVKIKELETVIYDNVDDLRKREIELINEHTNCVNISTSIHHKERKQIERLKQSDRLSQIKRLKLIEEFEKIETREIIIRTRNM